MKISSIIKPDSYTIKVNDSIDKTLDSMDKFHINGMPVVDDNNELVGMVVKADIYRFMVNPGHYKTCPVEWVMTKSVIFAEPEEDVITVANRLREKDIISMPIVKENKVIGIVNIEDLLDYFLNEK